MTSAQVYAGAAVVGAVAGMRSMAAPALASQIGRGSNLPVQRGALSWLGGPRSGMATTVLAAVEFIADKLPFIPARTTVGPLVTRALSGALSGAAVAGARRRSSWIGALCGAIGALGAAYGSYHLRRAATRKGRLPDPIAAIMEDALVAGAGYLLLTRLRDESATENAAFESSTVS